MKRLLISTLIIFSFYCTSSFAQVSDIGKFFAGGQADAEKLFQGYMGPYFNAFGASLTGGWYNTAKPHKLGGFDLTATINTAIVPTSDRTLNIEELNLESLKLAPGAESNTPSIAGDNNVGSQLNYNLNAMLPETKALDMPKGTGFPYIPTPMLQLGLGLIKDTEVMGRYMPTFKSGDFKIGMWGWGLKHGLKQWIPFIKKVPVLNLTLQYGFTKLNANVGLNVAPTDINALDATSNVSWENQKMEIITKSHTGNLLISADLPIVCFYGGIGFATSKTELGLKGNYPVADFTSAPVLEVTDASYIPDGLNFEFSNADGTKTKPRYNVGVRFKFAIVTLHFDYTYANYSMATAGLGFSFR
jgi:hypothetical protein